MSREIKFRAWDKGLAMSDPFGIKDARIHWRWVDGDLRSSHNVDDLSSSHPLMQFTGLYDKNGVEIYEGDVIEFDRREWGGDDNIHVVTWDAKEGAWCWGGGCSDDMQFRTVIGNIHENANLLEAK